MFYNSGINLCGGILMNIYEHCPTAEGERFALRLVGQEDCGDLLKVYADPAAVPLFNSDNCNGDDFHYTTEERMMEAIRVWLWSYEHGYFVRWSILDKAAQCAVGTIELCYRVSGDSYNGCGILRLDLRSDYENEADIGEILSVIVPPSFGWLGCGKLITKAKPIARERIKVLTQMGFAAEDEPLIGHDGTAYGDYYILTKR